MNNFEQRLRQVPPKALPPAWRAEILAAAEKALPAPPNRPRVSPWKWTALRELFWPHPKAWAGLAAIWLVILGLHLAERGAAPAGAKISAPPTPEMRAELRQQQQLLTELLGPPPVTDADRARSKFPQPRTQSVRILLV